MTENADATANTNPAPEQAPAPETPAPAPAEAPQEAPKPAEPQLNLTAEQAEQLNKFMTANGGFDKSFAKLKNAISNPQPKEEEPKQPEAPVQQPEQPAPQPAKIPEGYITQEEFAAQQYFNSLANNPEYANIADKINSGEVLKEMSKFGIKVSDNGAFNDRQIRDFLNMYSKTVPAAQTSTEPTNIPTVDYLEVDAVNSRDDALTIMRQSMEAQSKGLAAHPKFEDAKKFLQDNIFGIKK